MNFLKFDKKIQLLRISVGLIYLWFGALKFFAGWSPAEVLAQETLADLCFDLIPIPICYFLLAFLETSIGFMLLLRIMVAKVIFVALFHMAGTFAPMLLQPGLFFNEAPYSITFVGQYIVKNIVIISALIVLYPNDHSSRKS